MSSIGREYHGRPISKGIINALGQPRDEAMLQIERSLDSLSQSENESSHGLLLNLCRLLTRRSGNAHTLPKEELFAKLQPKYTASQIAGVMDQMESRGLIVSSDGFVKLSSGVLSNLINAKIQADTASQQKIEAFIANRFDYYLEKGQKKEQLLREQDLNYIDPLLKEVVLNRSQQEFIDKSRTAVNRDKRRSSMAIAVVIALLSTLASAAIFFAVRSQGQAAKAKEQENVAKAQGQIAEARAEELSIAKNVSDSMRSVLEVQNAELSEAKDSNEILLKQVTIEKDIAIQAQRSEQRQRQIAEEKTLLVEEEKRRVDSLNAILGHSVVEKENEARKAQAARDTARQEKDISEELRNILLSRIVAKRSLAMKEGDEDLKAYTAMLAYFVNESSKTNGDVSHPDVFKATYYAAKNLGSSVSSPSAALTGGAIGSILCDNGSCITGASDGSVTLFAINPANGGVQSVRKIFQYPHDAIQYVFPQKDAGSAASLFVLGAFDHILEISNPASGSDMATQLGSIEIPEKQFVKHASRISDTELLILATDGSVYRFDCVQRSLTMLLDPAVGVVACAVLPEQNLMCFATTEDELYLDNLGSDRLRETRLQYARAKKQVAQMQLRQYGETTYLAVAYLDGELEVFIAKDQAFLNVYRSRSQGKGGYQIQSLRSSVHTGFIPEMVFAESKPMLAVCSYDGTVSVWDLHKWEQRSGDYQALILDDHDDWVTSCAFLPGDNTMLTGSKLGTLKFWYLDTGKYAEGLCNGIRRSPTEDEWNEYIGEGLKGFKEKICLGK